FVVASFSLARKSGRSLSGAHRLHFENQGLVDELGIEVKIRKISETRLTDYNEVLSKLARQHPYDNLLKAINVMLETHIPGCKSSIMVLEEGGKWLQMASAPNLPTAYSQAINRVPAEQGVGSCGTAVSTNQPVTSADIKRDPLWASYKDITDIALAHGLAACTSFPIQNLGGEAIGTFAVYHPQVHTMTEDENACLSSAANLAGVVLERRRSEEKLQYLAHYDGLTGGFRQIQDHQ
ncbi:MAG: GAF domain-containing protein, partial [Methylophilales bacterium]|nr:GAF domain-containing protein [Methylophilales bacterium]